MIRSIIAPSLGDVFHENCFKKGVLGQTVTGPASRPHRFQVDGFRKQMLLSGQDEITLTPRVRERHHRLRDPPPRRVAVAGVEREPYGLNIRMSRATWPTMEAI